ncbi:phosphorylated adapter RNA export protein [Anopheles nili]|uniref:phosphorylated adapter RNA export protein n=1 Tax=Anopheles nili TaxID=185578 RepID=UPI00237AB384|nr:phosphorylated adapter RNA export protein [Anopheles nili]
MMDHETLNVPSAKQDLEDGELSDSDSDGYTPLARPEMAKSDFASASASLSRQMDIVSDEQDDEELLHQEKSDSEGSSDESSGNIRIRSMCYQNQRFGQAPRLMRPSSGRSHAPTKGPSSGKAREPASRPVTSVLPNKYNIWTQSLQEDTLMETMRGCDVTANGMRNRDVESYDYKLKTRLSSGNAFERLKRRQSNSDDSDGYAGGGKRMRTAHNSYSEGGDGERSSNVKERLGKRNNSTDTNSDDSTQSAPRFAFRHIPDLNLEEDCTDEKFAIELAEKLCEAHTELLTRVVVTLGREIPLKLFKETQKIEADGGMLVMKGWRRRTPGGVFLFLLKHCEHVDQETKKNIFQEDKKAKQKEWKQTKTSNRNQKVEELKKTLNRQAANDTELPCSLPIMSHLKAETHSTLSNPPPSPVGEENFECCPDFEARNIHVNVNTSPDKSHVMHANETDKDSDDASCPEGVPDRSLPDGRTISGEMRNIASYQEDCLDITCDDMDLF